MSERTKLLKKAYFTSVGAGSSVERIRTAFAEAMDDLVKVGADLFNDLELKGKDRTETAQNFIKGLQEEAGRRTKDLGSQVSSKAQVQMKKTAKDLGLITREEYDEMVERLNHLEEQLNGTSGSEEEGKKKSRKRSAAD